MQLVWSIIWCKMWRPLFHFLSLHIVLQWPQVSYQHCCNPSWKPLPSPGHLPLLPWSTYLHSCGVSESAIHELQEWVWWSPRKVESTSSIMLYVHVEQAHRKRVTVLFNHLMDVAGYIQHVTFISDARLQQCHWGLGFAPAERMVVSGLGLGGWSWVGHFSPLHKWAEKTVLLACRARVVHAVGPPFLAVMGDGRPRAVTIDCPLMSGCG